MREQFKNINKFKYLVKIISKKYGSGRRIKNWTLHYKWLRDEKYIKIELFADGYCRYDSFYEFEEGYLSSIRFNRILRLAIMRDIKRKRK